MTWHDVKINCDTHLTSSLSFSHLTEASTIKSVTVEASHRNDPSALCLNQIRAPKTRTAG